MARPRKKASELTTDEAVRRLFGRKGASLLKKVARQLDAEKAKKPKKKKRDD